MYAATAGYPGLIKLARRQLGVLSREQLRFVGLTDGYVKHQFHKQRWTPVARDVVLLQNAVPTRPQTMWIALLDAGPAAALAGHTSLEIQGMHGFASEASLVHVAAPRGRRCAQIGGVKVHESRRLERMPIVVVRGMPCVAAAVSVVDAAAWQPWPRFAVTMLAASVQQRLVTVGELDDAMRIVGRVRHKQWMRWALLDITGGAESLGEIDIAKMCRTFGLRAPDRQRLRRDSKGRKRYLDCEWDSEDGVIVLEIDGAHHMDAAHWEADMKRERQIVIGRRRVLRASSYEARAEQAELAADLRAAGVPSV